MTAFGIPLRLPGSAACRYVARYLFSVLGVFIIIYQRKGMFSNSRFNVFLMTGRFVDVTVDLLHGSY